MTLINDLLKRIKEAIYGEEVRGSIYDAIEQCYKDAVGHPESVAATVKEIGEVSANLSKETADRKAEVSTERKRIDNLIATGTAQTQEIGKKIIQDSSISSSGIVLKGLTNNNYYYKLFEESGSIDSEFCTITNQQGKYTAKLLKPGLYYMNFKVHVEMSGGFSEEVIAPLKLFKSNTLDWSTFDVLDAETVEISKTENTSINKKIHFLFKITEPSYIRIYIDVDTSHTKAITFRIDGCDITALDWKGKQSADLSELHDLRIGADSTVYGTAGEAVRKQIGNLTEDLGKLQNVVYYESDTNTGKTVYKKLNIKSGKTYFIYTTIPINCSTKNVGTESAETIQNIGNVQAGKTSFVATDDASYFRIYSYLTGTIVVICHDSYDGHIKDVVDELEDEVNLLVERMKNAENEIDDYEVIANLVGDASKLSFYLSSDKTGIHEYWNEEIQKNINTDTTIKIKYLGYTGQYLKYVRIDGKKSDGTYSVLKLLQSPVIGDEIVTKAPFDLSGIRIQIARTQKEYDVSFSCILTTDEYGLVKEVNMIKGGLNKAHLTRIYHVEKDGSGDFTKLVDAIEEAEKYMDSIVYVGKGE